MKCYVLMISKTFPAYHPRKGKFTFFKEKIKKGIKIHTIRDNYELWEKRINEVNQEIAYLSLREWSGLPRRSKQIEIMRKYNGEVGIQKLNCNDFGYHVDNNYLLTIHLSLNDGLLIQDYTSWFKGKHYVDMDSKAIIHFTDFRY